MVRAAEKSLGYALPTSYVDLLRTRNGGAPIQRYVRIESESEPVHIRAILGIDGPRGIDAEMGSRYLIKEWGLPNIGVIVAATESPEEAIMLDYSKDKRAKNPPVTFVSEQRRVRVAPSFEAFLALLSASPTAE